MSVMHIQAGEIRPVRAEWYNEIYAESLGWRWMSWVGIPIKGTPGYPKKMRVRQFLSPKQLESESWQVSLAASEGREADGTEPLSYSYCSSGCDVSLPPDLLGAGLAIDLSNCVHRLCKGVPHDIGLKLTAIVRAHLNQVYVIDPTGEETEMNG